MVKRERVFITKKIIQLTLICRINFKIKGNSDYAQNWRPIDGSVE